MPSGDPEAGAGVGEDDDKISPKFLESFNAEKAAIEKTIDGVRAATGAQAYPRAHTAHSFARLHSPRHPRLPFPPHCAARVDALTREAQAAFSPDELDRVSKLLQQEVKKASEEAKRGEATHCCAGRRAHAACARPRARAVRSRVPRHPIVPRRRAGKSLLDAMKRKGESLAGANPKGERVQPYKTQYMRLCKLYVETMKEHQRSKEAMRKTQTDTLVRRGEIVFGDTKTKEEIKDAVGRDPGGFLREAILTESSEEAQQAYTDAQSRARDIEMLVKCVRRGAAAPCRRRRRPLTPARPRPAGR